jgi:glutaredoxin
MGNREITLYTRRGCHLCEDAETLLRRLGYRYSAIDVDADSSLQVRYGDEVPVLAVDGQPVVSGIIRESAVRSALAR